MKNFNRIEIEDKKIPGLASMIAKSVNCTPDYVRKVLTGRAGTRKSKLSISIKKKYSEFIDIIKT